MKPSEIGPRVRRDLVEQGVSLKKWPEEQNIAPYEEPQVAGPGEAALAAVDAFNRMARDRVDERDADEDGDVYWVQEGTDDDLLLFEISRLPAASGGPPTSVTLILARHLSLSYEPNDGYGDNGRHEMWLTVEFPATDELLTFVGSHLWGHGGPPELSDGGTWPENWAGHSEAWTAAVARHPAYQDAFRSHEPLRFTLSWSGI